MLTLDFSSAASSPLSAYTELKRVKALLWIRLWLEEILWLVWSSIQTTRSSFISAISLFHLLIIHVFSGVAFSISFGEFSLAFTCLLTIWCRSPSFWPILALDILSSLNLIISNFWQAQVTLSSTEHLKGQCCRVINWLNFNTTVSQRIVRSKERGEMAYEWLTGDEVRTYTFIN